MRIESRVSFEALSSLEQLEGTRFVFRLAQELMLGMWPSTHSRQDINMTRQGQPIAVDAHPCTFFQVFVAPDFQTWRVPSLGNRRGEEGRLCSLCRLLHISKPRVWRNVTAKTDHVPRSYDYFELV